MLEAGQRGFKVSLFLLNRILINIDNIFQKPNK